MILGITGPAGSGKDTAADYLAQSIQAVHVSGGDVLREMLSSIGFEPKKSAIGDFGTFLRTHYGADAILMKVLAKADGAEHLVISGFRSEAEARLVSARGGKLIYIEAPSEIRHMRIAERKRSDENFTAEGLQKLDTQEHTSQQPMAENLEAVRAIVDEIVVNDNSLDDLYHKLDVVIEQYL